MVEVEDRVPKLHPVAVMSPTTKSLVASLEVKVKAIAAVLVVPPLATVLVEMVIVGAVPSYSQLNCAAAVLAFPTASVNVAPTSTVVAPSPLGVKVAV